MSFGTEIWWFELWTTNIKRILVYLYFLCLSRKAEQELLYEREKLEAAFDQQLKKEVGTTIRAIF